MDGLFGSVKSLLTKPFLGDETEFNILEWSAFTAFTVLVAFFAWGVLKAHFKE